MILAPPKKPCSSYHRTLAPSCPHWPFSLRLRPGPRSQAQEIQAQEPAPAAEEVPAPAPVRPPFDPTKLDPAKAGEQQMLLPNAQDKFLGLQLFLGADKVDWVQLYNDHALSLDVNSTESQGRNGLGRRCPGCRRSPGTAI